MAESSFAIEPGVIAITTYGMATIETLQCYGDTRAYFQSLGLNNVHFEIVIGTLVDKARNDVVAEKLLADPNRKWVAFLDADMVWSPAIFAHKERPGLGLFDVAFNTHPWADIVGGWCPLRKWPYLPTIDMGSGQWEPVEPNIGVVEVIRTGSACILIKRHVFEKMEPPWYGVRPSPRAIDMLAEVDNFARIKFDGRNPLREHAAWNALEKCASEEEQGRPRDEHNPYNAVGEDSNLCDRAKALGFRIVVNTHAVCNHVDRRIITPEDHVKAMREARDNEALISGILSS